MILKHKTLKHIIILNKKVKESIFMPKLKFFAKNKTASLKIYSTIIVIIFLCFFILSQPMTISGGALNGLIYCGNTLIPSLFPFMFIASFTVKSGAAFYLGNKLSILTEKLFGLPGYCSTTIILSMVGGYPVGARGVKSLYDDNMISDKEAEKMMYFCVGAGPSFIISVVGEQFLHNSKVGIILLVSQIISSILIGSIINLKEKIYNLKHPLIKKQQIHKNINNPQKNPDLTQAIVASCAESCSGIINMCAFVVLFAAFIEILNVSGIQNVTSNILQIFGMKKNVAISALPLLLEVMGGCKTGATNGINPELISFAICWGGICVHFQLFTALQKIKISKKRFWFFRFLHGTISSFITSVFLMLYNPVIQTSTQIYNNVKLTQTNSIFSSFILILCCILFLVSIKSSKT